MQLCRGDKSVQVDLTRDANYTCSNAHLHGKVMEKRNRKKLSVLGELFMFVFSTFYLCKCITELLNYSKHS